MALSWMKQKWLLLIKIVSVGIQWGPQEKRGVLENNKTCTRYIQPVCYSDHSLSYSNRFCARYHPRRSALWFVDQVTTIQPTNNIHTYTSVIFCFFLPYFFFLSACLMLFFFCFLIGCVSIWRYIEENGVSKCIIFFLRYSQWRVLKEISNQKFWFKIR